MSQSITHASSGVIQLSDTQTIRASSASHPQTFNYGYTWAVGTGLNQANRFWAQTGRTLATSTSDTFDLAGVLTDFAANVLTFVKLKEVYIQITSVVVGDILVVGAGSFPVPIFSSAAHTYPIGPGGLCHLVNPSLAGICTVTPGTGDILTLNNSGANTVTYNIALVGTSA